jgi:hypothetical protein
VPCAIWSTVGGHHFGRLLLLLLDGTENEKEHSTAMTCGKIRERGCVRSRRESLCSNSALMLV